MDEKTEIPSLFERLHRINQNAQLCSPKFTRICASNASEAMRSSTPASSKLLSSPWSRGMGNQSSGGGFSRPFKILPQIRVSKPTTKAPEARRYGLYATDGELFATDGELFATDDESFERIYNPSEAMLSATSTSSKLPWSLGIGNPSESFDPIRNLGEGIGKGIGGVWGSGSFSSIEGIGLPTRRLCDPVEFGFSHVGHRVEHRGEGSSGGGGSGVEKAGGQGSGGGNGNEGIGGGRQGGGIEGRQGGLRAGGHGGGNRDDDDGNNGGGRRISDIENGWMPRILREQNLATTFLPVNLQLFTVCFELDDANLSAFDSVLRCFALFCCLGSSVLFVASLLERDERAARNLSIIGAILTALGLISIIAVKVPPNLRFINGLAFLLLLAIFLKAYLA